MSNIHLRLAFLLAACVPSFALAQPAEQAAPEAAPAPDANVAPPTAPPAPTAAPAPDVSPEAAAAAAPTTGDDLGNSELARSGLLSDEQTLYEERYPPPERISATSPRELHDRAYWFFGGTYRQGFVPRALGKIFAEDVPSGINIPQYSLDFSRRRNGTEVIASIYYADYSFQGPFRGNGDTVPEYEYLRSSMRAVGVGATMLWGTHFSDIVQIQYGIGFGLGAMFGNVRRTEAYPTTGGPNSRDGFAACVGPNAPGAAGSEQPTDAFDPTYDTMYTSVEDFCNAPIDQNPAGGYTDPDGDDGAQYDVRARTLLNGGNVPFFHLRIVPQLSIRIKPIHQIAMRFDVGFDLFSGIILGGGFEYGF